MRKSLQITITKLKCRAGFATGRNESSQPLSHKYIFVKVSSAVCFLLSPAASFVNGATINVDGASRLYRVMFDIPGEWKKKCLNFSSSQSRTKNSFILNSV